jgi:hypothetical protein
MLPILEQTKIRITGTRALLLCRGESANPFDPQARAIKTISQKKKKTDEDHQNLARLQFYAAAYYYEDIGIYMPIDNLLKCCENGASKYNEGPLVKSQVLIKGFIGKELDSAAAQIIYKGPRTLEELYADKDFVSLTMGRIPGKKTSIPICRPIFKEWAIEFLVECSGITRERVMDYWKAAGELVGIGTWRPKHGLFKPAIIK